MRTDSSKPTREAMKMAAARGDGVAIRYIKNPSEDPRLDWVRQYGHAIQYIKNPSEAVRLAAVQSDGLAIQHIKKRKFITRLATWVSAVWLENDEDKLIARLVDWMKGGSGWRWDGAPSGAVQLAAVTQNGYAIQHIDNPGESIQLAAVRQHGWAIQFIKNPGEEIQLAAFLNESGFWSAGFWSDSFRPSALDLTRAIQESGCVFLTGGRYGRLDDPERLNAGVEAVRARLIDQPANDILDLAAAAPDLFDPPELRDVLRSALLQQASPTRGTETIRLI